MSRLQKYLIGFGVAVVSFTIIGFLILPPVIKHVALKKASEALHRHVTIESIKLNPYVGSITIKGLSIEDPGKKTPFVAFDELYVNVDVTSSIVKRALILEQIYESGLYIGVTRKADNTYNFSDLIPKTDAKKEEPTKDSKPFYFSLNNIQLLNNKFDFHDETCKTDHSIRDLNLSVPFASNISYYLNSYVEPKFSAVVNGNKIELVGKTQPFRETRTTNVDIELSDVDIPHYLKYVPVKMNFKLNSARFDTKLKLSFIIDKNKEPSIELSGNAALRKVLLDDLNNGKILHLSSLKVDIASVKPMIPDVHLSSIAIDSPDLVLIRDKKGELNLTQLVENKKKKEKKPKKDVKFKLDRFILDKGALAFTDRSTRQPVSILLNPLKLEATGISLDKDSEGKVSLSAVLDKTSGIKAEGPLCIDPVKTDLSLDLKNIRIRPFQAYFNDTVKVDITRGSVSSKGRFALSIPEDKKKNPEIKFSGDLSIVDLTTLEKQRQTDLLKWKSLSFEQIETNINPFSLSIKTISLSDYYARVAVNPNKSTNIQDVLADDGRKKPEKKTKEPKKQAKTNEKPADIKIGKIVFKGGTLDFTDKTITPNFSTRMLNVSGKLTGLTSQNMKSADFGLKGNLGVGAPIDISGKISPLAKDFFADVQVRCRNIETSPTTPYTNKYVAHPITKGKLNLDLSYLIDKRKLDAQNKVLIDQLTFGDKVESKDAVKVPVTMAVALLTDRKGQINLDIPVSGSLDDPKFSVWPIVWDVLVNIITKAALSPFKLLSSLTGGGEELSYVEFDPGSSAVTAADQKKIETLVKAMYERPNMKMDIEGYADPENDKSGLKKADLEHRIKAMKLQDILAKNETTKTIDEITLTAEEHDKYLNQVYNNTKIAKPKNSVGLQKDIPAAEKEKLLMSSIEITDSDVKNLAERRAQNVKDEILKSGTVTPDRVFIVEPKTVSPEKKDKIKDSRVDFKLK